VKHALEHSQDVPVLPSDLESMRDPYVLLDALRRGGPVRRIRTHQGFSSWLVSSYESVLAAVANPALSNNIKHARHLLEKSPGCGDRYDVFKNEHMLSSDPPEHIRLRGVVSKIFSSRNVKVLSPRIQEITDRLVDNFSSAGEVDLVRDFARPLPITIISDILGVSAEDRGPFEKLSFRVVQPRTPAVVQGVREAGAKLWHYMDRLANEKRRSPGEDVLSLLVQAEEEGRLSRTETIATAVLLLVAGHETTVSLISGTVLELLRHGQTYVTRGDRSALVLSIEETLRYNGPVMHNVRYTAEDTELLGVHIPKGNEVVLSTAAANRDPEHFSNPHNFDIARNWGGVHLGFGHGTHYCVGAGLARLETEIAVGTLFRRLPDITLAVPPDSLVWRPSFLRGVSELPLRFTAAPCVV
jgi:cytochrome P450